MLVYLKDSLLDSLPETETEMYEQCIFHTLIWDFCSKDPISSCSHKNALPISFNNINESSAIGSLLFYIAKLAYSGIQKGQSIFEGKEVEPVLQHTSSSLLVVDKMNVFQPTTYSFPHLTIQEFLAAFYFNTYLEQWVQKKVLIEYSNKPIRYVFWKFCCGLQRNENQTFLEFFILLYQYNSGSKLPFYCAHEAQSLIASQQLINFTEGIAKFDDLFSHYDAASLAFVAVSAAQDLLEITAYKCGKYTQPLLHKLCDAAIYSQLRKIKLHSINPSNFGCLVQKSPNLESLSITGVAGSYHWKNLQSEEAAALILPLHVPKLLNFRHIHLNFLNIGDKGVKKLSQLLQGSMFLESLSLNGNDISDKGASVIAYLMKTLPCLRHVYIHIPCW